MSENLKSVLTVLQNYVDAHGLREQVSLKLEENHVRITLPTEGRDLWLGRRYFLVTDPGDEPQTFFELNETALSGLLALPSGTEAGSKDGGDRSHFLFVSYSRDDEALIAPIVDLLRLADTEVFRDRDSIRPGDRWWEAIETAITRSTECLVFWCQHAASSTELAREVELALRLRKRLVPVLLDECPLKGELAAFQAIDMRRFKPHGEAASSSQPGGGTPTADLEPGGPPTSATFREAAAAYLRESLEELLDLEPLLLTAQPPNQTLELAEPSET